MKKLTLFLVAMLFSTLSFALNPFAYGLTSSLNADQTELTINYALNADATSATFVLLDGDNVILSQELSDIAKGTHTAKVNLNRPDMPLGKKLSWRIDVEGKEVSTPTEHTTNYSFFHPSAVDIDNNPENATFGLILCNEGMQSVVSKTSGYVSAKFGAGIFAFNPAFEPMPNGDKPGYNGGITFTNGRADNASATAYAPRRIRISEDGRIFVTSLNTDGNYLWEVNPKNMNEWTPVFKGTLNDNKELVDASGNFVAAPNNGFDVKGSGENLKLAMYSVNLPGITSAAMSGYRLHEYNLGTATEWATAPSKALVEGKYAINYTGTQVEYDNEGGIWIASYRGTASDANPGLVHINAAGVEDAKLIWNNVRQAGIRFNKDFTKLVVAGYNGAAKKATVYTISKDANGAPVLTQEVVVNMATVGNNLNDFAWDYAGNLYACGNSSEKLVAWAMPRKATDIVSTPCASKYEFTINSAAQMAKASELNPYAYNLTSTFDNTNKVLTINYTLNANANSVDIVIKDGNLELKRIACSGKTRGSYTEVISLASDNLPFNRELSWEVEVKGTSKSAPTQVSTYYSLYCPHGLAIDKNPNSEYFGRILAAEAMQAVPASGYLSSSKGAGLYAFTPEFATDGRVYNGGIDFTRKWEGVGYQPWRVKISEDGRIFVSSCDLNGKFVWELSKDLNTWTDVLARGQEKSSSTMKGNAFTTSNGQFLAGMNLSMDVIGSGKDLKLLLYSASGTAFSNSYTQSLFRLDEYALGEATKWDNAVAPKQITYFNGKYGYMYTNVNIIYDGEGGYWFGASRAGNAGQPNLVHFDKNGNRDYYSESSEFYGGDGILLHNGMLIKGKARTDANTGNFGVYTISKDASGNLVLTEKWSVKANHIGRNLNEFAVDYGENLYVVGNSGEKIIAFALPYSGTITTPCATKFTFSIEAYTMTTPVNDPAKGSVTGAGVYSPGSSVTITATPAPGYKLLYWSDRSKANPRTVIMDSDKAIAAYFVKEYEEEPTFTIQKVWEITNVPASSNNGFQAVGWDGKIYMKDRLGATINVYTEDGSEIYVNTDAFTSEDPLKGDQPIAIDDAGNIIIRSGSGLFYNPPTQVTIYKNGNKTGKVIDFSLPATGRCDFISASGDIYSAEGGYVYFYCDTKKVVNRIKITNGAATAADVTIDIVGGDLVDGCSQNHVIKDIFGNLVAHSRLNGIRALNVVTNEVTNFYTLPNLKTTTLGGCSFELGGKELWAYNVGSTSFTSEWNLYNVTDGKSLSEETLYAKDKTSRMEKGAANWLNVQVVDEKTAYIYQYCPTVAMAVWKVTTEKIVTIDENADNTTALTPFEGDVVTANVVRNFAPKGVFTLTLPFDMNASQIRTIFGNAKVYEFATVVEDEYEIHLQFSSTSSISAGKPYILVTPTTGGYDAEDGFTIENVTINTTPDPVTVGAITMVPALDAVGTLNKNNQYYLSGGGLYNAGTYNMALVGLRAYFESTSSLPIRARVVFQDNEATSIPMVEAQSENNVRKVMKNGQLIIIRGEQKYNVQGQRME